MAKEPYRRNLEIAKTIWPNLSSLALQALADLSETYSLSVAAGELLYLEGKWYITHAGLLGLARRKHCAGIQVQQIRSLCDPSTSRWAFKATVYRTRSCRGFVGFGDADPSNTADLVRGAEMRVAETRAVNRALRKAYGIGICSVEEIGTFSKQSMSEDNHRKRSPQPVNDNGANGQYRLRDRLCQLIRQHQLDPVLVKAYAIDFCGVKTLKEASREQVENFIDHVADWAAKDKNALVCQLNSYLGQKEGVA